METERGSSEDECDALDAGFVAWAQDGWLFSCPSGHCLRTTNSTPLFRRFKRQKEFRTTLDCTYPKIWCPPAPVASGTFGCLPDRPPGSPIVVSFRQVTILLGA